MCGEPEGLPCTKGQGGGLRRAGQWISFQLVFFHILNSNIMDQFKYEYIAYTYEYNHSKAISWDYNISDLGPYLEHLNTKMPKWDFIKLSKVLFSDKVIGKKEESVLLTTMLNPAKKYNFDPIGVE